MAGPTNRWLSSLNLVLKKKRRWVQSPPVTRKYSLYFAFSAAGGLTPINHTIFRIVWEARHPQGQVPVLSYIARPSKNLCAYKSTRVVHVSRCRPDGTWCGLYPRAFRARAQSYLAFIFLFSKPLCYCSIDLKTRSHHRIKVSLCKLKRHSGL